MQRLAVIVVLALAGFAAAFVAFRGEAEEGCLVDAPRDGSYAVEFAEPVSMDRTMHALAVTRAGEPVTDARVCVNVDMVGMSAMGAGNEAHEVEPGRYEVPLVFEMGGAWQGKVLVDEGEPGWDVAIPVRFDVTSGAGAGEMDGPMDGPMDGATDGPMDGPTDGPMDGPTDGPMDGAMDGMGESTS